MQIICYRRWMESKGGERKESDGIGGWADSRGACRCNVAEPKDVVDASYVRFRGEILRTISLSREQRRRQMTRAAQQGSAAAFGAALAFRLGLREFESLVRSFEYSPTVSRLRGSDRPLDQRTPSRAMTTPTSHLGIPF